MESETSSIQKHRPRGVLAEERHVVPGSRNEAVDDGFINRQSRVIEARKLRAIMHLCKHSQVSGAD